MGRLVYSITTKSLSTMYDKASQLGALLQANHLVLATAESCTGGWLAQIITSVPGSSGWFDRGFVTYSNESKSEMLGVDTKLIQQHGAVSEAVVMQMAEGALHRSKANLACGITGIAGPSGGSVEKPVGTVWFGIAARAFETKVYRFQFAGDRDAVRRQAVEFALEQLSNISTQLA